MITGTKVAVVTAVSTIGAIVVAARYTKKGNSAWNSVRKAAGFWTKKEMRDLKKQVRDALDDADKSVDDALANL